MISATERRSLSVGLAFLAPNILGFLAFTLIPLGVSLVFAFSNWNLRQHNPFKEETIEFTYFRNFTRLFEHPEFWRYLGNTLFLMLSIPISVAASLGAAMLLNRELPTRRSSLRLMAAMLVIWGAALGILAASGAAATTAVLFFGGLACGILFSGVLGGTTVYRTLFYLPSITSGVAVYILWTKLFNPHTGPINTTLRPVVDGLAGLVNALPESLFHGAQWIGLAIVLLITERALNRLRTMWNDGDAGTAVVLPLAACLAAPAVLVPRWLGGAISAWIAAAAMVIALLIHLAHMRKGRDFQSRPSEGVGTAMMFVFAVSALQLVLIGLAKVVGELPATASDGLEPPLWLADYHWAKPAMMILSFWAAVGSSNMLLYLAALTNIPQELYEAADMDGAGRFARFWNITWPQLAPTTFFIVIMACIGGLQGGFEMARSMTAGGPAGSTTVLSYFIYSEGFATGRLGFASAVAWVLFIMILIITLFNWRFGNRYVNE